MAEEEDEDRREALNEEAMAPVPTKKLRKPTEDSLTRYLFLDARVGKLRSDQLGRTTLSRP